MIQGVGIDIIEIDRIDEAIRKWGDRFVRRVYSEKEIAYCGSKHFPARHYAARFAAKEACLKSLGLGLGQGLALRDISVVNSRSGKPELSIDRDLNPILKNTNYMFHLSLSHSQAYASAVVVLEASRS